MARYMRSDLGRGHTTLRPPAVVGQGIVYPPIYGTLSPISDVQIAILRRGPLSVLRPPRVVTPATPFVAPPVAVTLAPSPTQARAAHPKLRPPVVIDLSPQVKYVSVNLTYSRRGVPKSLLFPPQAIAFPQPFVATPVSVNTTYSVAGKPKSRLFPPAVVGEGTVYQPIYGTLFPLGDAIRRPVQSVLSPPAVIVTEVVVVYYGPEVHLAYSVRGQPKSTLSPPTVVGEAVAQPHARRPVTWLTYSRRLRAKWGLAAPAVVFIASPVLHPVTVTLAYSLRGKPRPFLRRPALVGAVVYYGPSVTLTYSVRGRPKSVLRDPVVIDLRPQVFYLAVSLVRIRPQPTTTRLVPSAVTDALPKAERDIRVALAYSRRGRPIYKLRPPRVIDLRPQTRFVSVNLTYSRRGRTSWFLREPVLAVARVFAPVSTHLAYSVRKRGRSLLRKPVVVFPFRARPTDITFVRIHRPSTLTVLRPPVVVRAQFFARPVAVHLAYSRRGTPKSFLGLPTLEPERFYGPKTWLAEHAKPKPKSRLQPPADVGPGIYFRGIQVYLVRITPPPTISFLKPPTVLLPVSPGGDVCGDDTAADSAVCGSDTSESRITGSDSAVGDVCGNDEQST